MAWHIGNTTVRTPYRLKFALEALANSNLIGNLGRRNFGGVESELRFSKLLHDHGVVFVERIANGETEGYGDLGRKWRSALEQLGFITPDRTFGTNYPPYIITPNGARLIEAEITASQQECFLRSLVTYQIPSALENRYNFECFSPLRFVVQIITTLAEGGVEPFLSFTEFQLFVTAVPLTFTATKID